MIDRERAMLLKVAIQALHQTGQRGILLTGWGGMQDTELPKEVLAVKSIPHEWLFPRMAAIVHHGGAGTTAAALRSGVPSIVTPFFADQPFWGKVVERLRVGPAPILRKKLSVSGLAEAIRIATSDEGMKERASAIGEKIRREDGVIRAVEIVEGVIGSRDG
jgi:sterol 3beta-glucosyltransferase